MSKLSVALCTYNGAQFLGAQLESIANQTRLPDELVISDDCSTDSTVPIIRQFEARVSFPVRLYVNDRNIGSTPNFEHAISRCQGDVIALSDQDDVWLPTKLAKLERALDQDENIGMVFSDADLVDEGLHPLGRRLWEFTFPQSDQDKFRDGRWVDVLMAYNVVTGATAAFRAGFRELVLPIPEIPNTIHDGWIALLVGALSKLTFISEPLILYRQHGGQQRGVDLKLHEKRGSVDRQITYRHVAEYYALEIERLRAIRERLSAVEDRIRSGVSPWDKRAAELASRIADLDNVMTHYRMRGQLATERFHRLAPVTRELLAGRYHRYSSGMLSALRDLVRDATT